MVYELFIYKPFSKFGVKPFPPNFLPHLTRDGWVGMFWIDVVKVNESNDWVMSMSFMLYEVHTTPRSHNSVSLLWVSPSKPGLVSREEITYALLFISVLTSHAAALTKDQETSSFLNGWDRRLKQTLQFTRTCLHNQTYDPELSFYSFFLNPMFLTDSTLRIQEALNFSLIYISYLHISNERHNISTYHMILFQVSSLLCVSSVAMPPWHEHPSSQKSNEATASQNQGLSPPAETARNAGHPGNMLISLISK